MDYTVADAVDVGSGGGVAMHILRRQLLTRLLCAEGNDMLLVEACLALEWDEWDVPLRMVPREDP